MNTSNEIQQWITAGRHWHAGIALFVKHSNNQNLKNYFTKCEPTNANQDSLLYELKKIEQAFIPDASTGNVVTQPAAPSNFNSDAEIEKINSEWKPKFKELAGLRQRLMYYGKDEERRKAAFRILDLFDECKGLWRKRDYIIKHGSFPEIPEQTKALPDDAAKLILTRNNLRTRISKALKRMCLYEEEKQIARKKDIADWRMQIDFIEQKLKQMGTI